MTLFFSSLKFTEHSTKLIVNNPSFEALISSLEPLFARVLSAENIRVHQIAIGLLLEQDKPISSIDMPFVISILDSAVILELFEREWNAPSRSVKSATIITFNLLHRIFENRAIQRIISDECLTDFFSSEENLNLCLDFSAADNSGNDLIMCSTHKLYIKLAICFFEASLKSSWSLSTDEFINKISNLEGESKANKLAELIMMSGAVFQAYFYFKSLPSPNLTLLKNIQKYMGDIRALMSRIIGIIPMEIEDRYFRIFINELMPKDDIGCCYMILRTTRIAVVQNKILSYFTGKREFFERYRLAFGDDEPSWNDLKVIAEGALPDEVFSQACLVLTNEYVRTGKFDAIYTSLIGQKISAIDARIEMAIRRKSDFTKKMLLQQVESSVPALLKQMLYSFQNKVYNSNFATFHKILELILPNIEAQNNFLIQPELKDTSLANLINLRLVLIYVFDETHYLIARKPLTTAALKQIIKKNLQGSLFDRELFATNFHNLYFLALNYSGKHPVLDELFDSLNIVLEVLREERVKFAPIIKALLLKRDNYYPIIIDSYTKIMRLVDADLYKADQEAEALRLKALEDSIIADDEKDVRKKKPKGKKGKAVAAKAFVAALAPEIPPAATALDEAVPPEPVIVKPHVTAAPENQAPMIVQRLVEDAPYLVVSEPPSLGLKEKNDSLLKYIEAFIKEVKFELDNVHMSQGEVIKLRSLELNLMQRKQIIQSLQIYLEELMRAEDRMPFRMERLMQETLFLPDRFQDKVQRLQRLVDDYIASVLEPKVDKVIDVHCLINVISSLSISLISARELQSLNFIHRLKTNLRSLIERLHPMFIRILSNESQQPLPFNEVAYDAKNFWQLILKVNSWMDKIYSSPFDSHNFLDNLTFKMPAKRISDETVNNLGQLANEFSFIIREWNNEVNQFAEALLTAIAKDPVTSLTPVMQELYDKLSYCYFKHKHYPCIELLRTLFDDLAEVQIYGAQLTLDDCLDVDARLLWSNPLDSYDEIERKIKGALIRVCGPAGVNGFATQMRSLRDEHGEKIVFRVKALNGTLDINVFKSEYFPWKAYISHAAGCLDVKTGRMQYDHDFYRSYLNNRLLIKLPTEPDSSPRITCSRNSHILKLLIRVCYSDDPIKPDLCDEAKLMLQKFINFKDNLAGLKATEPDLADAISLLINQHFEHDYLTFGFFKRTEIILRFCHAIGINLIAEIQSKSVRIINSNPASFQLLVIEGGAYDARLNGLVIRLKKDFERHLVPVVPFAPVLTGHAGFFSAAPAPRLLPSSSESVLLQQGGSFKKVA